MPAVDERIGQFVGYDEPENIVKGTVTYLPHQFHQIPRIIREQLKPDLVILTVSPLLPSGHFTLGIGNDFIHAAVRCARRVIVEVNSHMPRTHGDNLLHIDDVDGIIENHVPLPPVERITGNETDQRIADKIAELVPEGATLQVGTGAMPGMVCQALEHHRDLGIHSELMVTGLTDLIECGAVTGARKTLLPGKHVYTLLVGDARALELAQDNPDFESRPVDFTNAPGIIARNERMVSINSALEIDLTGQINAETRDGQQFAAGGGQLDFVRGAYDAKDGKSILAFHATARKGTVSRVVPQLRRGTVVTTPRADVHWVVTEFGAVELKGLSIRERARALIGIAHPDFRETLERASHDLNLV